MIKLAMTDTSLALFAAIGLVVFFVVFVGVIVWALTRPGRAITNWSSLPLADGYEPVEPRLPAGAKAELPIVSSHEDEPKDSKPNEHQESCGKCENCAC